MYRCENATTKQARKTVHGHASQACDHEFKFLYSICTDHSRATISVWKLYLSLISAEASEASLRGPSSIKNQN